MSTAKDKQKCLDCLIQAIADLNGQANREQLTKISNLIIQTMTGPWRSFHTPNHIFEVGEGGDAIEVISALFHDLVYVQVDQGISVNISRYISPYIKQDREQLVILEPPELQEDVAFKMVIMLFGFQHGQPLLPMSGQNEFLSALIAIKALENMLPLTRLTEIAACIEATIPFRPQLESGLTCSDLLFGRLVEANEVFQFGWSDPEIAEIVKRAVRLSNRDVENFASPNSSRFLNNTWNLIPETNHDLKNVNSYSVHGYRVSIQKMEGFMNFLSPEIVFRRYRDEPSEKNYYKLLAQTKQNLEVSRLYLGTKLTSIAVLEALSFRIGRDISLSTMMGELPLEDTPVIGLEQFLPEIDTPHQPSTPIEAEVLELLDKGRTVDSSYDVKNSPVATFMVKSLGFSEMQRMLLLSKEFFKGNFTSEELIASCDPYVMSTIKGAVLQLFESRKAALSQ
ncbi:hypothetical protein [Pseudanabaena sp. UWO310]|uniref:hypothetical protein n=1 Tax=Pseudanabaena sp. UWO310 TaxID=2480795 RepID=UPI00116129A6|nr:hypothetical protein [Pseudanabaena sp. UWO310]TYQ23620.1 hypothetical protein PseudUWO310_22075 [Pseudanabaena sp. UWO310]